MRGPQKYKYWKKIVSIIKKKKKIMWACSLIQGMINVNCLQKFPYLELDFAKGI